MLIWYIHYIKMFHCTNIMRGQSRMLDGKTWVRRREINHKSKENQMFPYLRFFWNLHTWDLNVIIRACKTKWKCSTRVCITTSCINRIVYSWCGRTLKIGLASREQTSWELMPLSWWGHGRLKLVRKVEPLKHVRNCDNIDRVLLVGRMRL